MQRSSKILYKLILSFWVCAARHAQSTQNRKFAYLRNISRHGDEVALFFADKYESFLQNARIILGMCKQACQSTQNNNFAISLQYLKENGKNEVGFSLADKHQRFLQIDTIILGEARHAKITQNNKFAISLQYLVSVKK